MPHRVFLDWSSPLLPSLADKLLPAQGKGPLDLGDRLLLAPTQQAGRRLREYLATEWRLRGGTALLSMEVHPPSFLLQPESDTKLAHAFDWMPVWQDTLTGIDPESLPALLPQQKEPFSPQVALEFGQRLQRLREELLDAGLDLKQVADSPLLLSEQERWKDLAQLEEQYRDGLRNVDLHDPVDAKREALSSYNPPERIQKIILAAVPDPSPVILQRLQELDSQSDLKIEIWIHAPESEAEQFDAWGMPRPSWQTRHLGYEKEPEGWIECLAEPSALTQRIKMLMQELPDHPDLALGLLEDELVLPIQHAIEATGHKLYHPKPVKLAESPDLYLLQALQEQREQQDPVSLRALWRQTRILSALRPEHPMSLLKEWEAYAEKAFPENAQNVSETLPDGSLKQAWEKLGSWIEVDTAKGILELLEEIYAEQTLNPQNPAHRYQLRQKHQLAEILQEAARRESEGRGPSASVRLQVLQNENIDPPRVEGTLTAEGWLELAYHPAPHLLLIGFQEGIVPSVNHPDPFLPNQLREELGLRSDRDWLARDAYLFHSMIMSRKPGDVRVLVLKRDREGGPLLPSRLLLACSDELMLARAELLFRDPPPPALQPPPAPGLLFHPEFFPEKKCERLSVSAIKDYLHCPTRFYLKHILGLRFKGDNEIEPNAMSFGKVLHSVLQSVMRQGPCGISQWGERCEHELDHQLRTQFGSGGRMSLQVFRHAALSRLRAAGPIQIGLWEEGWQTLLTEQKRDRECKGVMICGVIDRIDVHPEKGYRIIDYKTHDQPEPPAKTHFGTPREGRELIQLQVGKKTKQWKDLQLPLYRWLSAEAPEVDTTRPLEVSYFNLPKATKDTKIESWNEEAELAEEAEKCLTTVVQLIQDQVWTPTSKTTPYDDYTPLLHHGNDWIPQNS